MARPKPSIIMENHNKDTNKSEQILEASAVYAVFYQGKPINVRMVNHISSSIGPKYRKSVFPNSGFALNLAKRLNALFCCTDFKVHKLVAGEEYTG
jgi:hypothetical protein